MHAAINEQLAFGKHTNGNCKKRDERRVEQCLIDLDTIGTPPIF